MTIIFDGTFSASDSAQNSGGEYQGPYGKWPASCLNPQISGKKTLQTVEAPGRPGEYAGLWTIYPGYGCSSAATDPAKKDNHAQLWRLGSATPKITTGEYWYGYSLRLASDWTPSESWQKLGMGAISNDYWVSYCDSTTGEINFVLPQGTTKYEIALNPDCGRVMASYYPILSSYQKDVWHDWMINVDYQKNETGFVHVWHRIEGQPWVKVMSVTGIRTKKDTPDETGWLQTRFGTYRGYAATVTQKFYGMRFKIGTTRADVEYPNGCPTPQCNFTITQ